MKIRCEEADSLLKGVVVPDCLSWEKAALDLCPLGNGYFLEDLYLDGPSKFPTVLKIFQEEALENPITNNLFITNYIEDEYSLTETYTMAWFQYLVYRQLAYPMAYVGKIFEDAYADKIEDKDELKRQTVEFIKRNKLVWRKEFKKEDLVIYYYPALMRKLMTHGITDFINFYTLKPILKNAKPIHIKISDPFNRKEQKDRLYNYLSVYFASSYLNWNFFRVAYSVFEDSRTLPQINKNFPTTCCLESMKNYIKGNFRK